VLPFEDDVRPYKFEDKVDGSKDLAKIALRITAIFRKEDEGWKIVHRLADPIVSNQPAESIIHK